MLAILASWHAPANEMAKFPDWAKRIIERTCRPPKQLDFEKNYFELPSIAQEVKNEEMLTKRDKAVVRLAKLELIRLSNRV